MSDFFGHGIATPFCRDQRGDFCHLGGEDLVRSCVQQVIGTQVGELPWRWGFGTKIETLRHRNMDFALREFLRVMIRDALRTWEPRTQVDRVETETDIEGHLVVHVFYTLITSNVRGNRVVNQGRNVSVVF